MYERITDRGRRIMRLANQEAQRLGCEYIGPEHILVGLIQEGSGLAAYLLKNLDVDLHKLRSDVEQAARLSNEPGAGARLPPRPSGKKVIEHAMAEAHDLRHDYVGSEHILLGLLREAGGAAQTALSAQGVTLERAREELVKLFGPGLRPELPPSGPRETEDLPPELAPIAAELEATIDRLSTAKLKAVADQDFEMAALLNDQEHTRQGERQTLLRDWIADRFAEPGWLSEVSDAVLELARTINDEQNWAALPQLADALEQAGCTDTEIINHCRQPGEHSSQCWVIELLLASS